MASLQNWMAECCVWQMISEDDKGICYHFRKGDSLPFSGTLCSSFSFLKLEFEWKLWFIISQDCICRWQTVCIEWEMWFMLIIYWHCLYFSREIYRKHLNAFGGGFWIWHWILVSFNVMCLYILMVVTLSALAWKLFFVWENHFISNTLTINRLSKNFKSDFWINKVLK